MDTGVYNNLLSTFDSKYTTKYVNDSHELRSVVKRIRTQTQKSPVYLVNFTNAKQEYVLGVKEASMKINESLKTLADDSPDGVFSKKKARSSDSDQIGAELLSSDQSRIPSAFTIRVKQMANSQINQGTEYYETGKGLQAGSYQFRITVNDVGYDFQYNIRRDANHREVIQGLSEFITKDKIGIKAEPYTTGTGKVGMRLESTMVGSPDGRESFTLQDRTVDEAGRGIVGYYGLNKVVVKPKNAIFDLNGVEKTSMNNEFTLGRVVKVSLHHTSDKEAMVDYHPDSDAIIEGIQGFVSSYNELIEHNIVFVNKTGTTPKLLHELKGLTNPFRNELESCGFTFDQDGYMDLDLSLAAQAIEAGDMQKIFQMDAAMTGRLYMKADAVKINPMEYVDKKVVSYPNFTKPPRGYSYITSLYSGLLFNSYC